MDRPRLVSLVAPTPAFSGDSPEDSAPVPADRRIRFAGLEADFALRTLHRDGAEVPIQEKPLHLLEILTRRPGRVWKREELARLLWPGVAYLDFDNSLNVAVRRLREALGDDASQPRFVATVPGHGYRFLMEARCVPPRRILREAEENQEDPWLSRLGRHREPPAPWSRRKALGTAALALLSGAGLSFFLSVFLSFGSSPGGRVPHPEEALFSKVPANPSSWEEDSALSGLDATKRLRLLQLRARSLLLMGRPYEAERLLRPALELVDRGAGNAALDADVFQVAAQVAAWRGDLARAEELVRRSVDLHGRRGARAEGAEAQALLAEILARKGLESAVPAALEAVRTARAAAGDFAPEVGRALRHLALAHLYLDDPFPAEQAARQSLALFRSSGPASAGDRTLETVTSLQTLAAVLFRAQRLDEAEVYVRESRQLSREALGEAPSTHVTTADLYLGVYRSLQGRHEEAEEILRQGLAMLQILGSQDDSAASSYLGALAFSVWKQGHLREAENLQQRTREIRLALFGERSGEVANANHNLACILLDQGRYEEAEEVQLEALGVRLQLFGHEGLQTAYSMVGLGQIYLATGRPMEARGMLTEALRVRRLQLPPGSPLIEETNALLQQSLT